MLMYIFPDPVVAPASKALVDIVPFAVLFRQEAPLCSTARDPGYTFNEESAVGFFPGICTGMTIQEGIEDSTEKRGLSCLMRVW
jgi:hypothetical protein